MPRKPKEALADRTDRPKKASGHSQTGTTGEPKKTAPTIQALQTEVNELKRRLFKAERHLELNRNLALMRPARRKKPSFEDLSLAIPNRLRGYLDRDDIDERKLDDDQKFYRKNGYLIKHGLIPAALTEPYLAERSAIQDETFSVWGGSYMDLESMRDVCLFDTLVDLVEKIVGRPVGLFLTLSGFKTTKREWHQDFYLKSGYENIDYCAAWIAVGDVSQDSGPYEFIPESHRLPPLRQELIWEWLEPNQRDTPGATRFAEKFVTAATGRLIKERSLQTKTFVPKRGDVLLWHPFLLHQGTVAKDPDLQRPGLIAHYNSLHTLQIRGRPLLQAPNGKHYVERTDREAIVKKRLSEKH